MVPHQAQTKTPGGTGLVKIRGNWTPTCCFSRERERQTQSQTEENRISDLHQGPGEGKSNRTQLKTNSEAGKQTGCPEEENGWIEIKAKKNENRTLSMREGVKRHTLDKDAVSGT